MVIGLDDPAYCKKNFDVELGLLLESSTEYLPQYRAPMQNDVLWDSHKGFIKNPFSLQGDPIILSVYLLLHVYPPHCCYYEDSSIDNIREATRIIN